LKNILASTAKSRARLGQCSTALWAGHSTRARA
jgi:hypothetical protein